MYRRFRQQFDPFNLNRYENGYRNGYRDGYWNGDQQGLVEGERSRGHSNKFLKELVLGTQDDKPTEVKKAAKENSDEGLLPYGGTSNPYAAYYLGYLGDRNPYAAYYPGNLGVRDDDSGYYESNSDDEPLPSYNPYRASLDRVNSDDPGYESGPDD